MDQTHRLSERNSVAELSLSQVASESDWKPNTDETPKPESNVISGRFQKVLVSESNVGRHSKRKRVTKNARNLVPQLQQPTLQGEKYRCYVPGCRRAREKKGNLSTHFKTEHIGVPWNIRLVEDPPISPSAAESSKAGITRPSSTTQNHPDRVAPLKPPPLWMKIFSSDTSSSAANSTLQIFATESGQNDHLSHLVVEGPYIQRHINKADSERQTLGPAPRGLRTAHNWENAIEDNSEEEEDVVELSFEHYRRRASKLGRPASQLKVHNERSTYVPPQLPKPHLCKPPSQTPNDRIRSPSLQQLDDDLAAFPPSAPPFSPRATTPVTSTEDAALSNPASTLFLQWRLKLLGDENQKLSTKTRNLTAGLLKLKAQSARMQSRIDWLLELSAAMDE